MKILIKIALFILNIFYSLFKLKKTKNKVSFISRQSNSPSLDFQLLIACFKKEMPDTKIYVSTNKIKSKIKFFFITLKDLYHIADSKLVILDSYSVAVSNFKHKENLEVIQMWHSMGSMKKFGFTSLGKSDGRDEDLSNLLNMHKNYDYIFASSEYYADNLLKGFGYNNRDKLKIFSLPRTDALKDREYEKRIKSKLYGKYPILEEKTNVLYAPTFRKDESELNKNIQKLIENFNFDKYNLIIKLHPLSKVLVEDKRVIIDKEYSTFEFLFVTDKIISDYSCVIYEASIRNIEIYLYTFDLEEYEEKRGIEIDLREEFRGYYYKDLNKLLKAIDKDYDINFVKTLKSKFIKDDKNTCQKIFKFLKERMDNNE